MPIRLALVLLLLLMAGCSGGEATTAPPASDESPALLDVWASLDDAFAGVAGREQEVCDTAFATWVADFGVRGLACAAAQVITPASLIERAGFAPFESGPHTASAEQVWLDLGAARAFGRYDPVFVRWLIENGIPDSDNAVARTLIQPVYDRRVRRLARIYWLTHADLEAKGFPESLPVGPLADYAAFLDGTTPPEEKLSFSVFAFTDLSETLLPRIGVSISNEWTAKYEANTAYGFWLRRYADGTLGLWHDGLRRLLQTYDAAWVPS